MKNDKILSVIIPTYNIEEYLEKCLSSFEHTNLLHIIEVIVVNDGSTDKSIDIANKYSKKYPNSYLVIDKENGGHGSTINCGLSHANGKYIMIVDGDDWIESENLYKICSLLKNDDSYDAVFYNYIMELKYKNKQKLRNLKKIFRAGDIDINKANITIYNQLGLANTIYRTKNLKNINLQLLEKTFYVDAQYMLFPMTTLKKVYYFDLPIYHYLIGRPTQSTNIGTALKRIDDRVRVIKSIIHYFNDKNKFNDFALRCYYSKVSSIINDYYELLIKGYSDFSSRIKAFDEYIFSNDKQLFEFLGKSYFYINRLRKKHYNDKKIIHFYRLNKLLILLKKR